jgi:outer membrane protein insertion porin family
VYEGELFNGTGMRRSKERVTQLGFFETVEVSQKPGSDNQHVVIQVEVKEKSTGTFQVGLGFSNVENFIFTAQIQQNNALGWGQSISLSGQISNLRQFLQASFFDQYFLDSEFIFAADFYRTQLDYFGFTRQATGGSLTFGYNFLEDVMAHAAYTLERVEIGAGGSGAAPCLFHDCQTGLTSSVRLSAQWDRRDNRLFATRGHLLFGSVDMAPSFFLGDLNYLRFTAYGRYYYPLPLGIVAKANLQVGYIYPLPSSRKQLPSSELYFLGGINTLRGYTLRSVAPTQACPAEVSASFPVVDCARGGDKQLFLNVEVEFPIVEKVGIRGVLFFDAGNVFAEQARFFEDKVYNNPLGLLYSVGFGFRWFSPIGPLRFEWGVPLTRRSVLDQSLPFEFTIGNSF